MKRSGTRDPPMETLAMLARPDALLVHGHARDTRGPIVAVHVDGDELLALARAARTALVQGVAMLGRILRMWYL